MGAVRGYLNKFKTPLQLGPAWNVYHSKAVQVSPSPWKSNPWPLSHLYSTPGWLLSCKWWDSSTGLFSTTLRWIPMVPRSEDFCHEEIIYRKSLPQVRVRVNGRYCSQILWRVHHDDINVLNVLKVTISSCLPQWPHPIFHQLHKSQCNILYNWMADPAHSISEVLCGHNNFYYYYFCLCTFYIVIVICLSSPPHHTCGQNCLSRQKCLKWGLKYIQYSKYICQINEQKNKYQ